MYFGNSNCILEYDGTEWRKIHMPNYSIVRNLAIDNKNILYAGAFNELGYLLPDEKGDLKYQSLIHLIDSNYLSFGDVWGIHCIDDNIYFLTDNYLFRYKNQQFDYWTKTKERFYLSFKIENDLYVQEMGTGLMKLMKDSLVLIDNGDFFSDKRIHTIIPFNNKLLVCTRTEGLYLLDSSKKPNKYTSFSELGVSAKNLNQYFLEHIFYYGIKLNDNLFALGSITGGVLIVNSNWEVVDIINEESTGVVSSSQYLYFEKDKALWIAMADGINHVDILSPFRYWNIDKGIHGTVSDVASLDDILYVSTGSGVYYTPRKSDQVDYSINNFKPVKGRFEQTWGFLYFISPSSDFNTLFNKIMDETSKYNPSSKDVMLLVASSTGLYQLIHDKSILISDYSGIFKIYQYKKDPSKIFLGLNNGIALLSYSNGKWNDHGIQYLNNDKIHQLIEDSLGNLWASAGYKGVYKIQDPLDKDKVKIRIFDENDGLPSVKSVQLVSFNDELVYISNGEFLVLNDSNTFSEYVFPEKSEKEELSERIIDSLSWYKVYEERTSGLFVTTYADSMTWFSTLNGVLRHYPTQIKDYSISPALIRKVSIGDSIIYNGTNYIIAENLEDTTIKRLLKSDPVVDIETVLEYKDNSLTFNYAVPSYEDESKNRYSYYLEGYDEEWSVWTTETKKEYTNLREKEYIFKVKAKNLYEIESEVAEFKFKILPPWYRRYGAILAYIIIGTILIIIIVRLYTYRLIKEKEKLEKVVIERTQEILMQKEEILVQAEHLKDANERISAKNEELEKQKWEITNQALKLKKANVELKKLSKVASETDNGIAIFDKELNMQWINEGFTRMYGYTYDQFKKEKNINILEGSDNPNIKEALRACVEEKKSVVYEFKTKTRDGRDIWAQTTLTHVFDKDGDTINIIAIDTDITKIKQAEKEIEEQRDKLAISNATKNKFFRIIAHDLRNPISTLAGSTNVILNDFDEYNKDQTKSFIGELNKLSQTTYNLLENLLDWSSSQMGEIKFEPKTTDLKLLTTENIELIKRKVDSKNISLNSSITKECNAFADENMVKTIIRNLLSNAVKFTPENGTIDILCSCENEIIKYSIKDSGIGISEEDQKKLFRMDKHYTRPGLANEKGSGLGLILCKEFVEKNGGTIEINSEPNKGTSITFTLKKFRV